MSEVTDDKDIQTVKYEKGSYSSTEEEISPTKLVKSDVEKKYVRKLNTRLLPLACMVIFLQFVDKAALSVAAVLGIMQDTGITYSQYSWLGALFFLGYLAYQPPNNYLLQKLPVGKYLGVMLVCWGAITIGSGFCNNFTELAVLRVFLGLFESVTYPALILILNTMYRRSEQSACFGFLWFSNGFASIIGFAAAYGIAKMEPVGGVAAWRWSFIIWGIITVVFGFLVFIFLIDSPQSKWLGLTEEEKEVVEERTRDNSVVRKRKVNQQQYWEAIKEPRLWLIFIMVLVNNLQNGGLILFANVLVKSLGFDTYQSIILQIPSGAMSALCVLGAVYLQRKTKQLAYSAIIMTVISMIGCLLLAVLPQTGIKLLAFYLTWPCTGAYTLMVTLVAGSVSGYSKKIFYNGAVMVAYTLGNFIGPLMIVDHEAPAYKSAMWGYFASNVLVIICFVILRMWLARLNKQKLSGRTSTPTDVNLNLTDREDPNWVYHL